MVKIYSWSARRAGAGITINHSCGKIVNVQEIVVDDSGRVVAKKATGDSYHLYVSQTV